MSSIDVLLSRLDRARKTGKQWVARCPAHEDRTASLSIGEGDDGRVLLHCFAGCSPVDVVGAVGLTLADLFPRRLSDRTRSPAERRALSTELRQARALAALGAVLPHVAIVEAAAQILLEQPDRGLDWADYSALARAHGAIYDVRRQLQDGVR